MNELQRTDLEFAKMTETMRRNEHWIDAMDEALKRIGVLYPLGMPNWELMYRKIKNALNGIRNEAAMNLPLNHKKYMTCYRARQRAIEGHEKYMDQQGDEPNKKG